MREKKRDMPRASQPGSHQTDRHGRSRKSKTYRKKGKKF